MFSSLSLKKSKELCFLCPHVAQPLASLLTGKKEKFYSVFSLGPSSVLLFFFLFYYPAQQQYSGSKTGSLTAVVEGRVAASL